MGRCRAHRGQYRNALPRVRRERYAVGSGHSVWLDGAIVEGQEMTVLVYEHPLSPYAQKVKIALDEKSVSYETRMPVAIGSGQPDKEFLKANPRGEVPALIDGDVTIFDSTIILEYIEDKWPEPAMLPRDPSHRAKARMIEEVMDTHFEPINWGLGELRWFKRAEGERARTGARDLFLVGAAARRPGRVRRCKVRMGRSVGRAVPQWRAGKRDRTRRAFGVGPVAEARQCSLF